MQEYLVLHAPAVWNIIHTSQYMPLTKAATWAEAPVARRRVAGMDQYMMAVVMG